MALFLCFCTSFCSRHPAGAARHPIAFPLTKNLADSFPTQAEEFAKSGVARSGFCLESAYLLVALPVATAGARSGFPQMGGKRFARHSNDLLSIRTAVYTRIDGAGPVLNNGTSGERLAEHNPSSSFLVPLSWPVTASPTPSARS